MTQTVLTADAVATRALDILENNLVMAKKVYRDYEGEYSKNVNGYKKGATIRIRKPTDFVVREGEVVDTQEVVEGYTNLTVDKVRGVDFEFSATDLSLSIDNEDLNDRVFKPAMVQLANKIDTDLALLYKDVWNWVGTPGNDVNSYADFALAPKRLDNGAVMQDMRYAVLSPGDHWGLLGSQTGLCIQDAAKGAYRDGSLGKIGGVDTYMSQNVQTHTCGTRDNTTPLADAAAGNGVLSTTYASAKDTGEMVLSCDGWSATETLKQGDVFTISTVYAVNPVSKATLPYLQQFVVKADVTVTNGDSEVTISPPIITSGAYQTVSEAAADGDTITNLGTASTGYAQNMVFHKNAFALTMVPMEMPNDGRPASRKSYKGLSIRVVPGYDFINNINKWRLDVLYGVKTLDARLATRLSGSAS